MKPSQDVEARRVDGYIVVAAQATSGDLALVSSLCIRDPSAMSAGILECPHSWMSLMQTTLKRGQSSPMLRKHDCTMRSSKSIRVLGLFTLHTIRKIFLSPAEVFFSVLPGSFSDARSQKCYSGWLLYRN